MKRLFYIKLTFILAASLMCAQNAIANAKKKAWSASDGTFYLKTTDGLETYTVDGTITFKAVADGKTIPTYRDCGVVFAPANDGEAIQVTVVSNDLASGNYILLYDGAIEKIGSGTSDGVEQSKYLPSGWVKKYTADNVGETYTSTASDGKLSFGFHSTSSYSQHGFTITVSSVSLKDMSYVDTKTENGAASVNRGAKNQLLMGVNVVTDGSNSALTLNSLSVATSALQGSTQVSNVRLYRGTNFTADNLLATASSLGDDLTISNLTLKGGNNRFSVVANVLPDATGTIPALSVKSVTVDNIARAPSSSTGATAEVSNVILMPAEATTFTISDAAQFFDDGGKDNKISSQFTGTVTFVPANEGQKIKVDFSKLAIFSTSTVGYNDVFKFYNGRTADEANLITTLLKEAKVVKSTADDGSMTITFSSTTGVPADGWEALVSQFIPGDMKLAGINVTSAAGTTVAAGDKATPTLIVDVLTDNQSNPLTLSALRLATTDAKNLEKVTILKLGEKPNFASSSTFGVATINGETVSASGEAVLAEGHNYFGVVADVKETALNGETLTLSLTNAVVNGSEQAPASSESCSLQVSNICHATKGSHSHTMYGDWTFTDTKSAYNSNKYEYEEADYITTFIPSEEGTKAQLDFSRFDIYYSSSSYGTRATFEVYSGTTADNAALLWKLNDANKASTGPDMSLRSQSADGALTIKFNPQTTSSYYAGNGWEATVSMFRNHDMTIDKVTVNQTSTENAAVGASNLQIIDFNAVTSGTLSAKNVTEIALNLKGCHAALSKVNVLYNTTNDFNTAINFGAVENPEANEVSVKGNQALQEGNNFFWVTFNVKNDAESGVVIDAKLVAITDSKKVVTTVDNGDPEGSRTAKNEVNMTTGSTTIIVNNPTMFYDDGGANDPCTVGFTGVTTFKPGKEGCAVQIHTESFSTGAGKLYVYDGEEVDDSQLVGTYNYTSGPVDHISKSADGALTFKFVGPTSTYTSYDGFAINVSLHTLTPFVVNEVSATAVRTDAVTRGATSATMQKVTVNVTGDRGAIAINNFKVSAAGTTNAVDITGAKLYYTAQTDNFSDKTLVASLASVTADGNNSFVADNDIVVSDFGNYYFWITYDINANASAGNTVAAQLQQIGIDGTATNATGEAALRTIKAGMKGTYTIGASSNAQYPTFAAATAALKENGVEGAVTMLVEDGTYAENIRLRAIDGVSATNTITFAPVNGDANTHVVITGAGYSAPDYGALKEGMVLIDSTSYVTFKSMSFAPADQSFPYAIHIYNQSRHVTLNNISVKADLVPSGYNGMTLVKTLAKDEDGKNNDFFTVANSSFYGGYIALGVGGTSYVKLTREEGLVVKNNVINEAGSKGIYITDEDNAIIDGNVINQSTAMRTSYWGIDLFRQRGSAVISNNKITNGHTYYSGGIQMRSESYGSDETPIRIFNNSVSITQSPSSSTSGIQLSADSKNVHLYYNTVRIAGDGGYCFYTPRVSSNERYTDIKLQNNLLQNMTPSGAVAFIYGSTYALRTAWSHNALFATSGKVLGDDDISAFCTLVGDTTNTAEAGEFVSETDLQLKSAGNLTTALPIAGITTDINGKERNALTPTIGAYEYAAIEAVAPVMAEGYPVISSIDETSAIATTKWNVSGKQYVKVVKSDIGSRAAITPDDLLTATPSSVIANSEASFKMANLESGTSYKAYIMLISSIDDAQSEIMESDEFTTVQHYDPLTIDLTNPYDVVEAGQSATIEPAVTGGAAPYTYEWRDQMNNVVGNAATLTVSPAYTYGYRLTVTSADQQTATVKTGVYVLGNAVPATFDDNYLAANSHYQGDNDSDTFYSGSYAFNVSNNDSWWYGYGISNSTATSFVTLSDQWNSAAGGGHDGSANYCVAYPNGTSIDITNSLDGDVVSGVYVTNSAYAKTSMANGDAFAKKFAQGDWFKLTANGTDEEGNTHSAEMYLADFRSENEANHYILDNWEWFDLSSLGKVTCITFVLSSSDVGSWGMNTPGYVCLDDFNAERVTTGVTTVATSNAQVTVAGGTISVAGANSVAIYSVSGALISTSSCTNVAPGIYIVTADGKAQKVVVK